MAVIDAAEAFSHLAKPRISCDPARCVKVRHRKASCTDCMDVCPTGAIEVADNAIAFHDERCLNCGACACVCPTQALTTTQPSAPQVAESLDQAHTLAQIADGTLFVACERARQLFCSGGEAGAGKHAASVPSGEAAADAGHFDAGPFEPGAFDAEVFDAAVISLPCLAHLDETLLVNALANGFARVCLADGGCAACPCAQDEVVEAVCDQTRRWLATWLDDPDADRTVTRADLSDPAAGTSFAGHVAGFADQLEATLGPAWRSVALDAEGDAMSRRGLFTSFVDRTIDSVAQAAVQTFDAGMSHQEKPTLAQQLTTNRRLKTFPVPRAELMLDTLYEFLPEERLMAAEQEQAPACAQQDGALFANRIFGTPCVSEECDCCGICVTFCPTGALTGTPTQHRSLMTASARAASSSADGEGTLFFRPNDCVSCGLCQDTCLRHALELEHGTDPARLFELEPRLLRAVTNG